MLFRESEITLARKLKATGLPWTPAPGHYVYDEAGLIEAPSPFQDRVYFILDLKHFLRRTESMGHLIESMTWLPDWKQTRILLHEHGVTNEQVQQCLIENNAISQNTELVCLYRLLLEVLSQK